MSSVYYDWIFDNVILIMYMKYNACSLLRVRSLSRKSTNFNFIYNIF